MSVSPTIVVLAGGLATRLGELTKTVPKSLLEVNGRPFLAWQLELFAAHGLCDVVLCVGHHADQIEAWVAANPIAGMTVRFSHDGPRQLGTGGALMRALPMVGESFLVTYGDSYLLCDYRAVYAHFERDERALGLMTVFENENQFDTSNVIYRDGRIVRYDKRVRVPEMRHIDWGLSVLTQRAFAAFARDEPLDLAHVFERLVERGQLLGLEVRQRFYEIGSHAGLEELSRLMAEQQDLRPA
jgi:NDP-sugar pyrophosphorylase family protein